MVTSYLLGLKEERSHLHGDIQTMAIGLLDMLLNCILHHSVGNCLFVFPTALWVELELPLLRDRAVVLGLGGSVGSASTTTASATMASSATAASSRLEPGHIQE